MTRTEVAEAVRAARQACGLSQVALASASGVSIGTVSMAERGGFLSDRTARLFAQVLGCSAAELIGPPPAAKALARRNNGSRHPQ